MWRSLVGQRDGPAFGLALGLAFHQQVQTPQQAGDFALLTGDDARKVVGDARQMRDSLFKPLGSLQRLLVHASSIR